MNDDPICNLTLSEAGLAFIARHEGFRAMTYNDAAGRATIGYGHLLAEDETYLDGITRQEALQLLAQDVQVAQDAVQDAITVTVTQPQFDALVSFTFNAGVGGFCRSTLLRYVNAGQPERAGDEFLRWDKVERQGVLVKEVGLAERRQAEKTLFMEGDYDG